MNRKVRSCRRNKCIRLLLYFSFLSVLVYACIRTVKPTASVNLELSCKKCLPNISDHLHVDDDNGGTKTKPYDLEIICMTFNRPKSLLRLLESLNCADYDHDKILLSVWIDRNVAGDFDKTIYLVARNFTFKDGDYKVNIHKQHVGLYGQWLTTFDVNSTYSGTKMVVFFEDDITVSPFFYKYLKLVDRKYDGQSEVNGYSLQGIQFQFARGSRGTIKCPTDQPVFKLSTLGSWGFSPNLPNWRQFLHWFDQAYKNISFQPNVPNHKATDWYREHLMRNAGDSLWTIWHIYYAWAHKEYTIFCNFHGHQGLSTNWQEDGLHFRGKVGKPTNPLLMKWTLNYSMLPDEPLKFDIAGNVIPEDE